MVSWTQNLSSYFYNTEERYRFVATKLWTKWNYQLTQKESQSTT